MAWDGDERRTNDELGWVKKLLIGTITGLLIHLGVGIYAASWFGGVVTTKLEYLEVQLSVITTEMRSYAADRARDGEAIKNITRLEEKVRENTVRISDLEKRSYRNP